MWPVQDTARPGYGRSGMWPVQDVAGPEYVVCACSLTVAPRGPWAGLVGGRSQDPAPLPFSRRISTVLTTNKYRSHDEQVPFSRAISTVLAVVSSPPSPGCRVRAGRSWGCRTPDASQGRSAASARGWTGRRCGWRWPPRRGPRPGRPRVPGGWWRPGRRRCPGRCPCLRGPPSPGCRRGRRGRRPCLPRPGRRRCRPGPR